MRPLIVIPTKDNVGSIADVARRCQAFCRDVLVVNDGSTDGTRAAAEAVPGVVVVSHEVNRGKGIALVTALTWAQRHGFSHIVSVDADGQHLPEELPRFLEAAQADPYALHVGVRDMEGAPGSSQFGRNFSNFWTWVETGHHVGDTQSGYRVYPVEPVLSLGVRGRRYEWEMEVIVRALWAGIAVRDVPCSVHYPDPEERVSSFRPFKDNVRISWLNTRLCFLRLIWPGRWINRVPEPGGEWQGHHLGRLWGWTFFLWFNRLLGRRLTYACMWVMALFYLSFAASHRRGIYAYLRRVSPDRTGAARFFAALRLYHRFACSLVDRFVLLAKGDRAFRFIHDGTEHAREAVASGSGALFLSAHVGNSDLGAAALQTEQDARPTVNIVQYTSANDPYLELMRRHAAENMPAIISLNAGQDMAALEVVRALRRGEIVALKGDRVIDDHVARVRFLGGTIELPTGPFLLAALSGAPLFYLGCFKEPGDAYRVIASEPRVLAYTSRKERQADLQRWAQDFADELEGWVVKYPDQWFNFFDCWVGDEAEKAISRAP